jgi:hypothetical protein
MNTEYGERHLPPGRPAGRGVPRRPSARRALRPAPVDASYTTGVVTQ